MPQSGTKKDKKLAHWLSEVKKMKDLMRKTGIKKWVKTSREEQI